MGILRAYFDTSGGESDPQHNALAVAGYVGTVDSWASLEAAWKEVLKKHGAPYLHMREFAHSIDAFEDWKNKDEERLSFITDLCYVIRETNVHGFGAVIRIADLKRFNQEKGLNVNGYSLGLYACMIELSIKYQEQIEIVLDPIHSRSTGMIREAQSYAESDLYYPSCGKIKVSLLSKGLTFRNFIPIQVADFAAWELRKSNERKNDWFANIKPQTAPENWILSLWVWEAEQSPTKTIEIPFGNERKSLVALTHAANIEGAIWDYRTLCNCDAARKGIWPQQGESRQRKSKTVQ